MGEHRRADDGSTPSRGVSAGPIVVIVALVVVAALVFGWFQLRDRIDDQGAEAARACVEGSAVLAVTADPDIAPQIQTLARRYDETAPVIRDFCITTEVTTAISAEVSVALVGAGSPPEATPARPSLWIPISSDAAAAVLSTPGAVNETPRPLATSPVVLAAPEELGSAFAAGATSWADLPRLAGDDTSLEALGLSGWGALRMALPTGSDSESDSGATPLAVHAVAAGLAGDPAGAALTGEQARSPDVVEGVATLARAYRAQSSDQGDTPAAVRALGGGADSAVHAVPATEQQVYAARSAGSAATAFRPAGVTPVADHPGIVLAGTDDTQRAAAADFASFVRSPAQQLTLSQAGFRVEDVDGTARGPADPRGMDFVAITNPAAPPEPAAATALAETVADPPDPVVPHTVTVLLDVSGSMETTDGGGTRLENTTSALSGAIGTRPDATAVGLWVYSSDVGGTTPYRIEEPTGPLSENGRRGALEADLRALRPATATSTYVSALAAYRSAVQNWSAGRPNSVLLVTDGPNDDTSVTSSRFLDDIRASADPARPVRIDVVSLAENSDLDTLRDLAGRTGGELVITQSSAPTLGADITRLMGG